VAVSCSSVPFARLELGGVTAMDTSVAVVTVSVVDPDTPPSAAVIVVWPIPAAVASPGEPDTLLMVATTVLDDAHVTELVRFWVELSEYVPVAVNVWVVPLATLGNEGVTAIDPSTAAVTVKLVDPETLPSVAVIVVDPGLRPLARPCELIEEIAVSRSSRRLTMTRPALSHRCKDPSQ
jgi:hypothetical protein